jgi:hypothetical protein
MLGERGHDVRPTERDGCVPDLQNVVVAEVAQNLSFLPNIPGQDVGVEQLQHIDVVLAMVEDSVDLALSSGNKNCLDLVATVDELSDGIHRRQRYRGRRYILRVRAAGFAVNMPSRGRPVVRLVVIDDASGSPVVAAAEEIPTDDAELAEQLYQVGRSVESRLRGLNIDRVIVRRADVPVMASKKDGPRIRLLIEGSVVSAARSTVTDTRLAMGKDVAHWGGKLKDELDEDATNLVTGAGHHAKFAEAAAAGLAGVALP